MINIVTITGPVAGVAIAYQDHISEIVVPPQVTQVLNDTFNMGQQGSLAEVVDAQFDNASRTLTLTVNFTNPLNYSLTLKSFCANVECSAHGYPLGQVNINEAGIIQPAEAILLTVFGAWTADGEAHIQTEHAGATSLDINLTGTVINMNDITIEITEPIEIPDVPIT